MVTVNEGTISPLRVGWVFLRLGLSTYGGAASVAIGDEVVRRQGWLTYDEYLAFRSIALVAPGPNSPALALLIGRHMAGWRGAVLAWLASSVPGVVMILIIGALALDPKAGLGGALRGCAAAAVGLNLANALTMTIESRKNALRLAGIALTVLAVLAFHLSLWFTFIAIVPLMFASRHFLRKRG